MTKFQKMAIKKIKPYKGGRTAVLSPCRVRPEIKEKLVRILSAKKLSFADWVEKKIQREKI